VEGIAPDNPELLRQHGLDPSKVAHHGIHIFLKMIFEHGFFHADPHAGNIFVQKNNRIALIDFGMVGSLKPSHMQFLAGFTLGLATRNPQRISDALLKLSGIKFFREKEDLEFQVQEMLKRYGSLRYEKIKFSAVLNECVKIILKFELKIPASIYLLIKALATLEKFGHNLDRHISLATFIKPYAIALIRKQYTPREVFSTLVNTVEDYVTMVRSFPGEVSEIMYKMKQGKLIHDIQLSNEEAFVKSFKQLGRIIALAFIIGFTFTGSSLMITNGRAYWLPELIFVISSILGIWLLLRLFFKIRI
jgi:ubiquinone biosynthesis protein